MIQPSDDIALHLFHRFQPVSPLLSLVSRASFHREMRNFLSIQGFLRLFAESGRINPFISSIYLDTDHLAQEIYYPLFLIFLHQ